MKIWTGRMYRLALVTAMPGLAAALHGQTAASIPRSLDHSLEDYMEVQDRTGSVKVPMDSWMYPALERLAALGLIGTQELGLRPWTRGECERQLVEAERSLDNGDFTNHVLEEGARLVRALRSEFLQAPSTDTATIQMYERQAVIAGPALNQSFTFAQTWWNDYGRPFNRGTSALIGVDARANRGRLFFGLRVEGQRDPGNPVLTAAQAATLSTYSFLPPGVAPVPASPGVPANFRHQTLALYAGFAFAGHQLSFGKQELYWGPGVMGPLSFSANAEPTYNLQLASARPHSLPFFPQLGTYSYDLVFGKLSGHHYPARPYFNGAKLNLVFADTLELGFSRWSILWGVGHPMTLGSLRRNLFSTSSTGTGLYGDRLDPGDRKSGFDFVLRPPGLRRYFTLYANSYSDDDPSAINAPRRIAWSPGIYLPQLPKLPHNDLRVEMVSTEALSEDEGGGRFFINNNYLDANTNKGLLLGSAVGRDARAIEGRTGYWFSGKSRVEFGYRQNYGGLRFLKGGGTVQDAFVQARYAFSPEWAVETFGQVERFRIPEFMAEPQRNGSLRFQIVWMPPASLSTRTFKTQLPKKR